MEGGMGVKDAEDFWNTAHRAMTDKQVDLFNSWHADMYLLIDRVLDDAATAHALTEHSAAERAFISAKKLKQFFCDQTPWFSK